MFHIFFDLVVQDIKTLQVNKYQSRNITIKEWMARQDLNSNPLSIIKEAENWPFDMYLE